MLADVLDGARDQLAIELERRAAVTVPTELLGGGTHGRVTALIQEVIEALRSEGTQTVAQPLPPFSPDADLALELKERELVKGYLLEQIERKALEASPSETAIIAEWAGLAERARLREQNQQLCALLDNVHESATLVAPDGRILYCNLRAAEGLHDVLGVPTSEIVGRTPAELGIPGDLIIGRSIDELVALARAHETHEVNAWGRVTEVEFEEVYGADGTLGAVAVLVRDVHSRSLAQARLSLLIKLNKLVGMADGDDVAAALAQIPIPDFADWCGISLVEDKRIVRTFVANRNPSLAILRDALVATFPTWDRHPLWQEMLGGGFQLLTEVSEDLLRKLAASEEQFRLMSRIGVRSLLVVPMVSRGQTTGVITCAYTAESGRRYGRDDPPLAEELALHAAHSFENARLMKHLKASETRFRIALAGARTAVYEQDRALRYVWAYNPFTPSNVVGKTHEEVFPPDEAAMLTALKRRVLDQGETVLEERDRTLGGAELRHCREAIEPLRDHTGRITGVIGATTDITDQQRTRQQLTEELEFRERMMGILGHDLRSPITAITLAADILLHRHDLPADGHDQVLRIRRVAGRMKEMIDTLLDFTRARFLGQVPVCPVAADLGDISRGAIDEMRVTWPDHPIELDVRGDSHGEWDPARMSQTISNLVGNAIAYGERGTPVRVSVQGEERDVDLKVHNDGPPIPPEVMAVLFQPFRRGMLGDPSPVGLGLGLYIVEQVVLAHDGTIGVESTPTDGTTFTLHLPRAHAAPAARGPAPRHA